MFRQLTLSWALLMVTMWVYTQVVIQSSGGFSFTPADWLPYVSTFGIWYATPLLIPAFVLTGLLIYGAFVVVANTALRPAAISGSLLALSLFVAGHAYWHAGGPLIYLLAGWSVVIAVRRATKRTVRPTTLIYSLIPVLGATRLIEWARTPTEHRSGVGWDWGAASNMGIILLYVLLER